MHEALVRLCLLDTGRAPDTCARSAADALADHLARREGRPVESPALIARNLRLAGLALPAAAQRRLDALAMREEARSTLAAEHHATLVALFDAAGIAAQPLRGWRFAELFYPDPHVRHSHALRWLVPEPETATRMAAILHDAGWTSRPASSLLASHKRIFAGDGRITAELHVRPFGWSSLQLDDGQTGSSAFAAAELIGSSIVEYRRTVGRWTADLVHLLRLAMPDPAAFAAIVNRFGFVDLAHDRLDHAVRLTSPDDMAVHAAVERLRSALVAIGHARDSRAVRDVRQLAAMRAASGSRFLLQAVRRPDLLLRGRRLRHEQHMQRALNVAGRAGLLNALRAARR